MFKKIKILNNMSLEQITQRLENLEALFQNTNISSKDISNVSIDHFIDDILNDPETNTILPDSLERNFYRKIITIVLKSLQKTLSTAKISILHHNITFNLASENDNSNSSNNNE